MTRSLVDRRSILVVSGLAATALVLPGRALAAPAGQIPQPRSARVIVDTDFAGDPDALIAGATHFGDGPAQVSAGARIPTVVGSILWRAI